MQKVKSTDCLDPFLELCKKFDLKITPQRCAIYKKLVRAKDHPSADDMFHIVNKEFPNISYDTVNRTLMKFAEIGLVDVIPTKGGPRRFDPDVDKHHHFHCLDCGEILDIHSDELDNIEIPPHIQDGYTVYTKRVLLNGLCKKCLGKKRIKDRNIAIRDKKKINKGESK
jgi:Fur family peroxide stress response transcriptional regulator